MHICARVAAVKTFSVGTDLTEITEPSGIAAQELSGRHHGKAHTLHDLPQEAVREGSQRIAARRPL